ncbi:MAG: oligosaccharide flippase family protein [Clostridium sp.]
MKKTVKNKVVSNYIYNSLYQVLTIIIPIITIPYVSRIFGAKGMGIYGYTFSVAQFFYIVGMFGISSYGIREIAYVRNDRKKTKCIYFGRFNSGWIYRPCDTRVCWINCLYCNIIYNK